MDARKKFARYAWGVLSYNIAVIVWGAFVRASGSGAGCGAHWPLCNGTVFTKSPRWETLVEFSHRITSGLALIGVVGLVIGAWRAFPKGHIVRKGATLSMTFILTEALIGAGLVLFGLVASNSSLARVFSMILHLSNTFVLLGWLTLTAAWASGLPAPRRELVKKTPVFAFATGFALILTVGITGAIAALGDTLFPATTLIQGFHQDFDQTSHLLLKLRVLHPAFAIGTSIFIILFARSFQTRRDAQGIALTASQWLVGLVLAQLSIGFINLALLAPVALQLTHLLLADLVWVAWIVFTGAFFTLDLEQEEFRP